MGHVLGGSLGISPGVRKTGENGQSDLSYKKDQENEFLPKCYRELAVYLTTLFHGLLNGNDVV